MLAKKNRLTKKEFNRVYAEGRKIHTQNFLIIYNNSLNKTVKVAVVASAKKIKKASLRNEKRRFLYALLRDLQILEKNGEIIIFYKNTEDVKGNQFRAELCKILNNIK